MKTKKVRIDKIAAQRYGVRTWAKGTCPLILAKAFEAGIRYGRDSSVFEVCQLGSDYSYIENAEYVLRSSCEVIKARAKKTKLMVVK
jgi:hypothetical protein